MRSVSFNNLKPVQTLIADEVNTAIQRVLNRGWYILGPEVEAFEAQYAKYHGVKHAVGVANGTDAIELALRAAGIGAGDEVITVAHTAVATVCAIERAGATPILVDIKADTYTIDPAAVKAAITPRTKAIIPVHLYGHPADLDVLMDIASKHALLLIEDCAQAHGAQYKGKRVGTVGHLATFSFYPTKNLGAYGDGGAVITNDDHYAARLKSLRNYGQMTRYYHEERGVNSRLDEMQAAILQVKLRHLDNHNAMRREIAEIYQQTLTGVTLPISTENSFHVYHLYVIRHPQRDQLMNILKERGIQTLIHYPVPVHLQNGYRDLNLPAGSLPVTEQMAGEILSLPMYVGLTEEDVRHIGNTISEITTGVLANA